MSKKKIAFICVHNSCRSQIAEALGKHLAGDKFDFYSACLDSEIVVIIEIVNKFLFELFHGLEFLQIEQLTFE